MKLIIQWGMGVIRMGYSIGGEGLQVGSRSLAWDGGVDRVSSLATTGVQSFPQRLEFPIVGVFER
jgi:hypothetical protein